MLTLLDTLNELYPHLIYTSSLGDPNDYSGITIISGGELPAQTQLESDRVALCKDAKIRELSETYREQIMSGFTSDALGATHRYDSELEDQINILGSVVATLVMSLPSMVYGCLDITKTVKEYKDHTAAQLVQVYATGVQVKLDFLQRFHLKRLHILGLPNDYTTLPLLDSITWDSDEYIPQG